MLLIIVENVILTKRIFYKYLHKINYFYKIIPNLKFHSNYKRFRYSQKFL
jgi:hypothetical protein